MSTIAALAPDQTTPEAQAVLSAVESKLGVVPNLFRVAANSPAALNALAGLNGALAKGRLRAKVRESIALAVAQENGCDYCLSAHTALGKGAGLSDADIASARAGKATDPHAEAILALTGEIVRKRGAVGADAIEAARAAGVTDTELVEIVAHVALNTFTNYLNILAGTEIDFPVVRASEPARV
jgi:uncharacterized peroxidase-related enzyme